MNPAGSLEVFKKWRTGDKSWIDAAEWPAATSLGFALGYPRHWTSRYLPSIPALSLYRHGHKRSQCWTVGHGRDRPCPMEDAVDVP